jgi:hypothetical protein
MNKWITALVTIVTAVCSAATGLASTVTYDFDREVDFSKWKSLAWAGPDSHGTTLAEERIRRAIETGFQEKGFTVVADRQKADFLITYRAATWRDVELEEALRGPGFGRSVRLKRVPKGILVVDVIDRSTGKLAWRGAVSDTLADNPEKADKKAAKAIAKLLKYFPAASSDS